MTVRFGIELALVAALMAVPSCTEADTSSSEVVTEATSRTRVMVVDRVDEIGTGEALQLVEPPIPLLECELLLPRELPPGSLVLFFSRRIRIGWGRFGPQDGEGIPTIHAEGVLRDRPWQRGDDDALFLALMRTPLSAALAAGLGNRAPVAAQGLGPEPALVFAVDERANASDVVDALQGCADLAGHPFTVCFLLDAWERGRGVVCFSLQIPMSSMEDVIQVDPPRWQGSYVSEELTVSIRMTTRVGGDASSGSPSFRIGPVTLGELLTAANRTCEAMRRSTTSRVLLEVRDGVPWKLVAEFAARCVCCGASELWMGPMYR